MQNILLWIKLAAGVTLTALLFLTKSGNTPRTGKYSKLVQVRSGLKRGKVAGDWFNGRLNDFDDSVIAATDIACN